MRGRRTMAVGLAGLLVLAGCGGGDDEAGEVVTARPLDLMAAVEGAGSARWSASYSLVEPADGPDGTGPGLTQEAELEGVSDYQRQLTSASGSLRIEVAAVEAAVDEPPAPLEFGVEARRIGDEAWTRWSEPGAEPGPWELDGSFASDEDEADEDEADEGGALTGAEAEDDSDLLAELDPTRLGPDEILSVIRDEVGDLLAAGPDDLDGVATTRYEATWAVAGTPDAALFPPGTEVGTVEAWVDEQARLRRVVAGGMEMDLWDFGVAVEVEEPADVADEADGPDIFDGAELAGEWAVEATGSTDGQDWTVYAAPAREGDADVTCRTFEPGPPGEPEQADADDVGLEHGVTRGSAWATCGGGYGLFTFLGGAVEDPAVQVLLLDSGGISTDGLVAVVVSPRFRPAPVRVVAEDGSVEEVPLDDAGVAVWRASGQVAALELDGGAVRCEVREEQDEVEETEPGDAVYDLVYALGPCVRA